MLGRVHFLSREEESSLRRAIAKRTPQHVPAFDLSLHSGMRTSEEFALRWSQVDWQRRMLASKNGKSRHTPLNAIAMEVLWILRQRHAEQSADSPRVFQNERGGKLRGHRDWFEPALRESGVHDYSWHCNRHTFASRLVMVGVDLRTVGELLGHETPSMTWRYSHLASGHKQRAVDRLVAEGESVVDARSATRAATSEVATKLVGNDV